ncbi:hypothetical protein NUU61_001459 [Penicillium alfredii]|uniref:Uncharacterized protein n=1 Tax=Penicillium alfredii TaxID=1506179 RepID=A0A9W9G4E1_9EURO|nr:uncharacterized protein NUU61_001459 [Penicillium alfredii]KAJ5111829.1 hypothetical protein NUU61_001459 [Penicillium alfredii]
MPKADYIPWNPWEVENLPRWLSQHSMLSWKAKSEAYFRQYNLPRTPEGLRSKLNQLIKPPSNPDGRLPTYHRSAARRARHRRHRELQGFPAPHFACPAESSPHKDSNPLAASAWIETV